MVSAEVSDWVHLTLGGEEQHVFVSGLDVMLGHDSWLLSGASFFVISRLALEQHFFGLPNVLSFTEENSVAHMKGSSILSISVQRHSARSTAAFRWAKENCVLVRGVD